MLIKLLANILGSIIKSSDMNSNVNDRDFNIKKTLLILGVALLFVSLIFLLGRMKTLSLKLIDLETNYSCFAKGSTPKVPPAKIKTVTNAKKVNTVP